MKLLKAISIAINLLYITLVLLFFIDRYTIIEIKIQWLKSLVYLGIAIGIPIILIWNYKSLSNRTGKIVGSIIPVLMTLYIIAINPLSLMFLASAWHTQTIDYKNANGKRIEYQMQDTGAFGYNTRTVEVYYITPLFMIVHKPKRKHINDAEWIKVNEDVNEMGLR